MLECWDQLDAPKAFIVIIFIVVVIYSQTELQVIIGW